MRTLLTAAIAPVSLSAAAEAQEAPAEVGSEPEFVSAFFGPGPGYRVTIQSATGVVSVLEVPDGVFLNVTGPVDPEPGQGALERRWFRGDVTIRARRADEVDLSRSRAASDIMAGSPLTISLEDVTVVVDEIEGAGG